MARQARPGPLDSLLGDFRFYITTVAGGVLLLASAVVSAAQGRSVVTTVLWALLGIACLLGFGFVLHRSWRRSIAQTRSEGER